MSLKGRDVIFYVILAIINYQSSIINHQSSIINYQSSIINHQSSIIYYLPMKRDLLVPTWWDRKRLEPLLKSLASSTVQPDTVIFLLHTVLLQSEVVELHDRIESMSWRDVTLISSFSWTYIPGNGVGYDRNYLISQAQHEYLFMIDDDNQFDPEFFEHVLWEYHNSLVTTPDTQILYSPLIQWRTSTKIQSAWITWFNRWMPAYTYATPWSSSIRKMIWANSLFWPTKLFQDIWFDAQFISCLEDIDFSYRVFLSWAKIIVSDFLKIQHMESKKTYLQQKFLWTSMQAYERSKNRIYFAKKNATLFQKIWYFGLWVWAQTFWFLILSLVYGWSERCALMSNVLKGTFEAIFSNNN